jgi:ABC-type transport system involved in multi-copper enzyme maturation permease subunit
MTFRWGLGPVFAYEWLTTSRRWQYYAGRSLFVSLLLVALVVVWWSEAESKQALTLRTLAAIGERYFYAIIGTQLALILLVAPAVTAGSICVDKTRGTLLHLLVTDLSNAEIVLGKLANRLGTLVGLVACALPVLFLGTLVGGIDPEALVGAFIITLGVALVTGTLGLTLSVWCHRTYEALLAVYSLIAVTQLINPAWRVCLTVAPPSWMAYLDLFGLAFEPYLRPGAAGIDRAMNFLAGSVVLAGLLAALSVWRIRAVAIRHSARPRRHIRLGRLHLTTVMPRWLPRPSLDSNPVLWREWRRGSASGWVTLIWIAYAGLSLVFTLYAIKALSARETGAFVNAFQVSIGLLLVSIGAVTSLTEDRTRGTLDMLLTTPIPTRSIVFAKWCTIYRTAILLTVLPGTMALAFTWEKNTWEALWLLLGLILAYGAAFTSLGLALATWISRPSRAVTLCVVIYVLSAVGWVMAPLLMRSAGSRMDAVGIGSPWFGPGEITFEVSRSGNPHSSHLEAAMCWMLVYGIAALILLASTVATFDVSVGRSSFTRFAARRRTKVTAVGSQAV